MRWRRASAAAAAATTAVTAAAWAQMKPADVLTARESTRQRRVLAEATLSPAAAAASQQMLTRGQLDSICSRVESTGICVVEDVLSAEARTYLDRAAAAVWQTRGQLVYGRVLSDLMDAPEREPIERLCAGLLPFVEAFFGSEGDQSNSGVNSATGSQAEQAEGRRQRWYLSQLQFVDAMPGCSSQFWHCDNTARGLTILLPLVPTTAANGPTELFPASHRIWQRGGASANDANAGSPAATAAAIGDLLSGARSTPLEVAPVRATVGAGAAIIYDSRTLHRGRTNLTQGRRPALVLRYDLHSTPPPGMGVAATSMLRFAGELAERLSSHGATGGTVAEIEDRA